MGDTMEARARGTLTALREQEANTPKVTETPPPPASTEPPLRGKMKVTKDGRTPATFHIDLALTRAVKDAVIYLSGPPLFMTLQTLVEGALREKLTQLEDEFNGGKPFPTAKSYSERTMLKPGRAMERP